MLDPAPEKTPPPPLGAGVPNIELPEEEAGAPNVEAPDDPPPKIPPVLLPPPNAGVEVAAPPPNGFLLALSEEAAPPKPPRKPPLPPPPPPKMLEEAAAGVEAPKTELDAGVAEAPKTDAEEVGAAPNTELEPPNADAEVDAVLLAAPNTDPELGAADVAAPNTDPDPPNAEGAEVAVDAPKTDPDPNPEAEVATVPKGEETVLAEVVVEPKGDESGVLEGAPDELNTDGFEPPNGDEAEETGAALPNMEEAAGFPNAEELEDPNTDCVVVVAEVVAAPKIEEVDLAPNAEFRVDTGDIVVAVLELPNIELLDGDSWAAGCSGTGALVPKIEAVVEAVEGVAAPNIEPAGEAAVVAPKIEVFEEVLNGDGDAEEVFPPKTELLSAGLAAPNIDP